VARDGVEPPTPAFSGLRSTNVMLLTQLHITASFLPLFSRFL
jgi:hypothetical protein